MKGDKILCDIRLSSICIQSGTVKRDKVVFLFQSPVQTRKKKKLNDATFGWREANIQTHKVQHQVTKNWHFTRYKRVVQYAGHQHRSVGIKEYKCECRHEESLSHLGVYMMASLQRVRNSHAFVLISMGRIIYVCLLFIITIIYNNL